MSGCEDKNMSVRDNRRRRGRRHVAFSLCVSVCASHAGCIILSFSPFLSLEVWVALNQFLKITKPSQLLFEVLPFLSSAIQKNHTKHKFVLFVYTFVFVRRKGQLVRGFSLWKFYFYYLFMSHKHYFLSSLSINKFVFVLSLAAVVLFTSLYSVEIALTCQNHII